MASNTFGNVLTYTTFGESHGPGIGVIVDGVPAGIALDESMVQEDLDKRRPGQSRVTTPRVESDTVHILSGVFEGQTTGHPVGMLINNADAVSTQYDNIKDLFRPGHADFTWFGKYGIRDHRGSGRASARETACRVAAGALAKQILKKPGVTIAAGGVQIGDIRAAVFDPAAVYANPVRSADPGVAGEMEALVLRLAGEKDSIGGVVECRVDGLPVGLGEPVCHKLDAELAFAIMGLGAVKGVEFGEGFAAALLRGSENNDPLTKAGFSSNHAGGVLGGVSTGQQLVFRVAVKPTSSIAKTQHSLSVEGEPVEFAIDGRHDPCLIPRIVTVIEAMTAFVLADLYLMNRLARI